MKEVWAALVISRYDDGGVGVYLVNTDVWGGGIVYLHRFSFTDIVRLFGR